MASNADTPQALALGVALRAARQHFGISQRALAARLARSSSDISRWENGKMIPCEADTASALGVLQVTGAERDRLLKLARDAADPNWLAPGADRQLALLMDYERRAERISNVEPLLIPGLLQTAEYAMNLMTSYGFTRGEADRLVRDRLSRRDVLMKPEPATLTAIVGEHALRYPPVAGNAAAEQLGHLLDWMKRGNVTVRVLPFGRTYTAALEGSFAVMEFGDGHAVAHEEGYRSAVTVTDKKGVADYQRALRRVLDVAMHPKESATLVADIHEDHTRESTA